MIPSPGPAGPERVFFVEGNALARFRANPARVRISVRREGDRFRAAVSSRIDEKFPHTFGYARSARAAVLSALRRAKEVGLSGVDLELSWTYEHPWAAAYWPGGPTSWEAWCRSYARPVSPLPGVNPG